MSILARMGTKFASYTLKLASLHEFYQRLLHGTQPIPSGIDMANTVKYFSQSLLCLLKDVEKSPYDMLKYEKLDIERMALFPNLDYKQLYNALSQLVDVIPAIHSGAQVFGRTLLQCLACLLPFLDHDLVDSLPYLTASMIAVLPEDLHQEIVNYLCFYILPFTMKRITEDEAESHASRSISAVIMMIFEYSNNSAQHCQLLECLMALKNGIIKDILCIIAYGTTLAKSSATKLLFYYWPTFNSKLLETKSSFTKLSNNITPFVCQRDDCPNSGNAEAAKVCYNHFMSIKYAADLPPPLYLCIECANEIHRENPNQEFCDILHPTQQVSLVCENKNCRANDKTAFSICFSTECASYNSNHPIRYCRQCHDIRHNKRRGNDHIYHSALNHISQMDLQTQSYMVQAIISLLQEVEPNVIDSNRDISEMYLTKTNSFRTCGNNVQSCQDNSESMSLEERQLLGRYGVWLLIGLCSPNKELPEEILGRLLSMLFHWFYITAYSFDGTKKSLIHLIFSVGQAESTLEKLKTEHVCTWLFEVMKKYYGIFISCLLPHPLDYVRVGGHWESLSSRTSHLKDGLNRLFCLVPYDVITPEIWDSVMPYWMEAIVNDVPIHELQDLKIILCKILDPDMSPLGFDTTKIYNFIAKRFSNTDSKIQEQALTWLQMLTRLEITVPLSNLFSMFSDGVAVHEKDLVDRHDNCDSDATLDKLSYIKNSVVDRLDESPSEKSTPLSDEDTTASKHLKFTTAEELNLSCCILMLDILLKQMDLQNIDKHAGVNSNICKDVCHLLKSINVTYWSSKHSCNNVSECSFCESTVMWHQLSLQLLLYIVPDKLAYPPDMINEESTEDHDRKSLSEVAKKNESNPDVVISMPVPETHSVGGVLVHMPHFFEQIMTATVETVSEQLDLATVMPAENIMSAVARAVTLSDTDVATAIVNVDKPNIVGEDDKPLQDGDAELENFWQTSMGKFRFCLNELPDQLQYIHKLLKELVIVKNSDILCYMLDCLSMMCLYGDILSVAIKDHQGFFIWCQENLIIKNLWELLNAEHSQIAQMAVPLLLHSITLPCGMDTFWSIIQEEFHHSDWHVRFAAVERVTLIARFMDSTPLKSAVQLQTALANIFCYLVNSLDDTNVYVAQKATLLLGTIHDTAMKALVMCMETQFDLAIVDRPIILQTLYQLHNCLSDRRILSWEFFLNRFDTLFIEAQINLEKSGDINYFRDLKSTELGSEIFVKKLQRAHEALSTTNDNGSSTKTLSSSFGAKWPYKRTMSAPASINPRTDSKYGSEKEKVYNRQYSAPTLKRKSSKFGLGQLIGYTLPNNSIAEIHIPSLSLIEDGNISSFTQKIVELEEMDKETMHLLIFLLMQFLSRPDQAYPMDDKSFSKTQNIVLRHLYILLGYNQTDKNFYVSPQKLRSSAVFNAFMSNLPQVLDQNHILGILLIQPCLIILRNSSRPPQKVILADNFNPAYSLWYLESYTRRSWLLTVLVVLYKYEYYQQPWYSILQILIKIVLYTLDRQYHKCKHIPATVVMSNNPSRSRDVSLPSLDMEQNVALSAFDEVDGPTPIRSIAVNHRTTTTTTTNQMSIPPSEEPTNTYVKKLSSITNGKSKDLQTVDTTDNNLNNQDLTEQKLSFIYNDEVDNNNDQNNMSTRNSMNRHFSDINENRKISVANDFHMPISIPAFERLLPIGSNIRTDVSDSIYKLNCSPNFQNLSELRIPMLERLLPIGTRKDKTPEKIDEEGKVLDGKRIRSTDKQSNEADLSAEKKYLKKMDDRKQAYSKNEDDCSKDKITNPKKLKKQAALDSPTFISDLENGCFQPSINIRDSSNNVQSTKCKVGVTHCKEEHANESRFRYAMPCDLNNDLSSQQKYHAAVDLKPSICRIGEECNYTRCSECGLIKEEYIDEELGLCIIILETFIHREPYLAAPLLPEILNTVTNVSINISYPWQKESGVHIPGSAVSVAHQFLRCVLHQMAPNGIFMQIFQTNIKGATRFFKSIVQALTDFNELNPIAPLQILLENLNAKKNLSTEALPIILYNISCYLESLPLEAGLGPGATTWNGLIVQFDVFYRRLVLLLPSIDDVSSPIRIMISLLKVPGLQQSKGMLDPFSKVLSYVIQNAVINYSYLMDICYWCHRNFTRDRDKNYLCRTIVFELIQAIKFKSMIPDTNFLLLLQFALQDVGGLMLSTIQLYKTQSHFRLLYSSNISDSLRSQMHDIIDFLMDIHSSSKIKSYTIGLRCGLNEDTLSGALKCGLAQYLALEITKGNNRETRAIIRYFPWLYSTPSSVTLGVREYLEYISQIRLLSWLLLGSLAHTIAVFNHNVMQLHSLPWPSAQPIPQDASCYIADRVQIILSAFPEQYRTSTINMSSLFHVFNLCQLWTLYLEQYSKNNMANTESHNTTINILLEFWGKVTPCILQLVSHSKIVADIVNHHFLCLLETLLDCGCTSMHKLLPIWSLILFSHHIQIPEHLLSRLQNCSNIEISKLKFNFERQDPNLLLLQCLRRLQFKMGQIELQSSNITQFYVL